MLCIHTIILLSILCRVPKRDAEISGNVDLMIGFAQLACQLSTVNILFTSIQYLALADQYNT